MVKRHQGKQKQKKLKLPAPDVTSTSKTPTYQQLDRSIPYRLCKASFSFEFYDQNHKKYSAKAIHKCKDFCLAFDHLKKLSCMTWQEIENGKNHAHDVTWEHTKEKNGFPARLGQMPQEYNPYQFQLYGAFRVFGFHNSGIFYIVWFDPHHNIDPSH